MQCVEVVHAVIIARLGPLAPVSMESSPAVMLMMLPGMKNGEMRRGPLAFLGVRQLIGQLEQFIELFEEAFELFPHQSDDPVFFELDNGSPALDDLDGILDHDIWDDLIDHN
jgi:hypothetical protein